MEKYTRNCPGCNKVLTYTHRRGLRVATKNNSVCVACIQLDKRKKFEEKYGVNYYSLYKKCPSCNDDMTYSCHSSFWRAVEYNYKCQSCAMIIDHPKDPSSYNFETKKWFKKCSICDNLITYGRYKSYQKGVERNTTCRLCYSKEKANRPKFKKLMRERFISMRADPNSKINSKEVKDKKSAAIKKIWADPNGPYNEEWNAKRSEQYKLMYQDPNSSVNSPENKEKRKNQLTNMMKKQKDKISGAETSLFKKISHLGFIHNKFTIQIDKYFPDIIHEKKKIIVEFYGDFWHANPKIYKDDNDIINYKSGSKTAGCIRQRDAERKITLEQKGYIVIIVWEKDFKSKRNHQQIINEINHIVNSN